MTTDNRHRAWLQKLLTTRRDFGEYQGRFEPSFEEIQAAFSALQQLHELAAQIIDLYYCVNQNTQHTYGAIGIKLGRSGVRVRQLSERGLRILRFTLSRRLYEQVSADVRRHDDEYVALKEKVARLELQLQGVSPTNGDRALTETIASLNLSGRTRECLMQAKIHIVSELVEVTPEYLLSLQNFGKKSLAEIERRLFERGLRLSK